MANHVELSSRAERDLRRLGRPALDRVVRALREGLTADPPPANLDVKALEGAAPWLRMRVGDYRIVYRPLTAVEMDALRARSVALGGERGYLVSRIVNRRDLERAIGGLA